MTRQRVRKLILLISLLAFPITLYYFSPALILQGAFEGIITGSFIVFTIQLFSALFFGRAFCAWLCPAGGLQEACMMAVDRKAKGGRLNWIKYIIWVLWMGMIVFFFLQGKKALKIDFLYQTVSGISVSGPMAYIIYYGVVGLVFVLAICFGKRAFCHYGCWMAPFMVIGSWLKKKLHIPSLHLAAESHQCIGCQKCNKACVMSLDVSGMVEKGKVFHTECILCGECIDTCPKKVLRYKVGIMEEGCGKEWQKHEKPNM